jgi:hypothetical protein
METKPTCLSEQLSRSAPIDFEKNAKFHFVAFSSTFCNFNLSFQLVPGLPLRSSEVKFRSLNFVLSSALRRLERSIEGRFELSPC